MVSWDLHITFHLLFTLHIFINRHKQIPIGNAFIMRMKGYWSIDHLYAAANGKVAPKGRIRWKTTGNSWIDVWKMSEYGRSNWFFMTCHHLKKIGKTFFFPIVISLSCFQNRLTDVLGVYNAPETCAVDCTLHSLYIHVGKWCDICVNFRQKKATHEPADLSTWPSFCKNEEFILLC